jgi:cytidylate kinase
MSKKKLKKIYKYECTITGEVFKTTAEAKNPGDLTTVSAFYQMNPELDDRPLEIKLKVKNEEETAAALKALVE